MSYSADTYIPELTVIIPFLNEGLEVVNTVNSIRRFAGRRVDVIVINDGSDDGYPYEEQLTPLGVTYLVNAERIGAGASRGAARHISCSLTPICGSMNRNGLTQYAGCLTVMTAACSVAVPSRSVAMMTGR